MLMPAGGTLRSANGSLLRYNLLQNSVFLLGSPLTKQSAQAGRKGCSSTEPANITQMWVGASMLQSIASFLTEKYEQAIPFLAKR